MNIEASSIHASPVSQPDVPLVSAPPLDISHHASPRPGPGHHRDDGLGPGYSVGVSGQLLSVRESLSTKNQFLRLVF